MGRRRKINPTEDLASAKPFGGIMPHEQYVLLSQVERLKMHVENQQPLLDEDRAYLRDLTLIIQSVIRAHSPEETEHKLRFLFPPNEYTGQQLRRMEQDAIEVFDCFYEIDVASLRVVQLRRYESIYELAIQQRNEQMAIRAANQIDKLYALTKVTGAPVTRVPAIPAALRTSDVSALRKTYANEEEE